MYRDRARYYDSIYSWKKYDQESRELLDILKRNQKSGGNELLDVGCGTGEHLTLLSKNYRCTGVDVNSGILGIARKKHPRIKFLKQDMRRLRVGKKFDAVVTLFSAIGYLTTRRDLKIAIRKMSDHLKTGGVLIIEPWLEPLTYKAGLPHIADYKSEDLCLARVNVSRRQGNISIMDMHWLVAEKGKDVSAFVDTHRMLLTAYEDILEIMRDADLRSKKITSKTGMRGLLVGVKL